MLKKIKLTLLGLTCAAFVLAAGCGLFGTRTPEDPVTVRSTFEPPTTPEAVLRNLAFSIEEKNSNNYMKCLSPTSYVYVPDSKSQSLYGTLFQNWNLNSERFYYENLIAQTNSTASSTLFLSDTLLNQITPDSAVYTAEYIVVFQHNRTNIPKSAIGNTRISLKADESNFYYISKWEDFRRNDSDFTWSELKANFSN